MDEWLLVEVYDFIISQLLVDEAGHLSRLRSHRSNSPAGGDGAPLLPETTQSPAASQCTDAAIFDLSIGYCLRKRQRRARREDREWSALQAVAKRESASVRDGFSVRDSISVRDSMSLTSKRDSLSQAFTNLLQICAADDERSAVTVERRSSSRRASYGDLSVFREPVVPLPETPAVTGPGVFVWAAAFCRFDSDRWKLAEGFSPQDLLRLDNNKKSSRRLLDRRVVVFGPWHLRGVSEDGDGVLKPLQWIRHGKLEAMSRAMEELSSQSSAVSGGDERMLRILPVFPRWLRNIPLRVAQIDLPLTEYVAHAGRIAAAYAATVRQAAAAGLAVSSISVSGSPVSVSGVPASVKAFLLRPSAPRRQWGHPLRLRLEDIACPKSAADVLAVARSFQDETAACSEEIEDPGELRPHTRAKLRAILRLSQSLPPFPESSPAEVSDKDDRIELLREYTPSVSHLLLRAIHRPGFSNDDFSLLLSVSVSLGARTGQPQSFALAIFACVWRLLSSVVLEHPVETSVHEAETQETASLEAFDEMFFLSNFDLLTWTTLGKVRDLDWPGKVFKPRDSGSTKVANMSPLVATLQRTGNAKELLEQLDSPDSSLIASRFHQSLSRSSKTGCQSTQDIVFSLPCKTDKRDDLCSTLAQAGHEDVVILTRSHSSFPGGTAPSAVPLALSYIPNVHDMWCGSSSAGPLVPEGAPSETLVDSQESTNSQLQTVVSNELFFGGTHVCQILLSCVSMNEMEKQLKETTDLDCWWGAFQVGVVLDVSHLDPNAKKPSIVHSGLRSELGGSWPSGILAGAENSVCLSQQGVVWVGREPGGGDYGRTETPGPLASPLSPGIDLFVSAREDHAIPQWVVTLILNADENRLSVFVRGQTVVASLPMIRDNLTQGFRFAISLSPRFCAELIEPPHLSEEELPLVTIEPETTNRQPSLSDPVNLRRARILAFAWHRMVAKAHESMISATSRGVPETETAQLRRPWILANTNLETLSLLQKSVEVLATLAALTGPAVPNRDSVSEFLSLQLAPDPLDLIGGVLWSVIRVLTLSVRYYPVQMSQRDIMPIHLSHWLIKGPPYGAEPLLASSLLLYLLVKSCGVQDYVDSRLSRLTADAVRRVWDTETPSPRQLAGPAIMTAKSAASVLQETHGAASVVLAGLRPETETSPLVLTFRSVWRDALDDALLALLHTCDARLLLACVTPAGDKMATGGSDAVPAGDGTRFLTFPSYAFFVIPASLVAPTVHSVLQVDWSLCGFVSTLEDFVTAVWKPSGETETPRLVEPESLSLGKAETAPDTETPPATPPFSDADQGDMCSISSRPPPRQRLSPLLSFVSLRQLAVRSLECLHILSMPALISIIYCSASPPPALPMRLLKVLCQIAIIDASTLDQVQQTLSDTVGVSISSAVSTFALKATRILRHIFLQVLGLVSSRLHAVAEELAVTPNESKGDVLGNVRDFNSLLDCASRLVAQFFTNLNLCRPAPSYSPVDSSTDTEASCYSETKTALPCQVLVASPLVEVIHLVVEPMLASLHSIAFAVKALCLPSQPCFATLQLSLGINRFLQQLLPLVGDLAAMLTGSSALSKTVWSAKQLASEGASLGSWAIFREAPASMGPVSRLLTWPAVPANLCLDLASRDSASVAAPLISMATNPTTPPAWFAEEHLATTGHSLSQLHVLETPHPLRLDWDDNTKRRINVWQKAFKFEEKDLNVPCCDVLVYFHPKTQLSSNDLTLNITVKRYKFASPSAAQDFYSSPLHGVLGESRSLVAENRRIVVKNFSYMDECPKQMRLKYVISMTITLKARLQKRVAKELWGFEAVLVSNTPFYTVELTPSLRLCLSSCDVAFSLVNSTLALHAQYVKSDVATESVASLAPRIKSAQLLRVKACLSEASAGGLTSFLAPFLPSLPSTQLLELQQTTRVAVRALALDPTAPLFYRTVVAVLFTLEAFHSTRLLPTSIAYRAISDAIQRLISRHRQNMDSASTDTTVSVSALLSDLFWKCGLLLSLIELESEMTPCKSLAVFSCSPAETQIIQTSSLWPLLSCDVSFRDLLSLLLAPLWTATHLGQNWRSITCALSIESRAPLIETELLRVHPLAVSDVRPPLVASLAAESTVRHLALVEQLCAPAAVSVSPLSHGRFSASPMLKLLHSVCQLWTSDSPLPEHWIRSLWKPSSSSNIVAEPGCGLAAFLVHPLLPLENRDELVKALCDLMLAVSRLLTRDFVPQDLSEISDEFEDALNDKHFGSLCGSPVHLRAVSSLVRQSAVVCYLLRLVSWVLTRHRNCFSSSALVVHSSAVSQLITHAVVGFRRTVAHFDRALSTWPWGSLVGRALERRRLLQQSVKKASVPPDPGARRISAPWSEAVACVAVLVRDPRILDQSGSDEDGDAEDNDEGTPAVSEPVSVAFVEQHFVLAGSCGPHVELWVRHACHSYAETVFAALPPRGRRPLAEEKLVPPKIVNETPTLRRSGSKELTPPISNSTARDSNLLQHLDPSPLESLSGEWLDLKALLQSSGRRSTPAAFLVRGHHVSSAPLLTDAGVRLPLGIGSISLKPGVTPARVSFVTQRYPLVPPTPANLFLWKLKDQPTARPWLATPWRPPMQPTTRVSGRDTLSLSKLAQYEWMTHGAVVCQSVFSVLVSCVDHTLSACSPRYQSLRDSTVVLLLDLIRDHLHTGSIPVPSTALGECCSSTVKISKTDTDLCCLPETIRRKEASGESDTAPLSLSTLATPALATGTPSRPLPYFATFPSVLEWETGEFLQRLQRGDLLDDRDALQFDATLENTFAETLLAGTVSQNASVSRTRVSSLANENTCLVGARAVRRYCRLLLPPQSPTTHHLKAKVATRALLQLERVSERCALVANQLLQQGRRYAAAEFLQAQADVSATMSLLKQQLVPPSSAVERRGCRKPIARVPSSGAERWRLCAPLLAYPALSHLQNPFPDTTSPTATHRALRSLLNPPDSLRRSLEDTLWASPQLSESRGCVLSSVTPVPLLFPTWWKVYVPHACSFELDVVKGNRIAKLAAGKIRPSNSTNKKVFHYCDEHVCDFNRVGTESQTCWNLMPSAIVRSTEREPALLNPRPTENCESALGHGSQTHTSSGAVIDILIIPKVTKQYLTIRAGGRSWNVPFQSKRLRKYGDTRKPMSRNQSGTLSLAGDKTGRHLNVETCSPASRLRQRLKRFLAFLEARQSKMNAPVLIGPSSRSSCLSSNLEFRLCVTTSDDVARGIKVGVHRSDPSGWELTQFIYDRAWTDALQRKVIVRVAPTHGPGDCALQVSREDAKMTEFVPVNLVRHSILSPLPVSLNMPAEHSAVSVLDSPEPLLAASPFISPATAEFVRSSLETPPRVLATNGNASAVWQEAMRAAVSRHVIDTELFSASQEAVRFELGAALIANAKIGCLRGFCDEWCVSLRVAAIDFVTNATALLGLSPLSFHETRTRSLENRMRWGFSKLLSLLTLFKAPACSNASPLALSASRLFEVFGDTATETGSGGGETVPAAGHKVWFDPLVAMDAAALVENVEGYSQVKDRWHSAWTADTSKLPVSHFLNKVKDKTRHKFLHLFVTQTHNLSRFVHILWHLFVTLLKSTCISGIDSSHGHPEARCLRLHALNAVAELAIRMEALAAEAKLRITGPLSLQNAPFAASLVRVCAWYLAPLVNRCRVLGTQACISTAAGSMPFQTPTADFLDLAAARIDALTAFAAFSGRVFFLTHNFSPSACMVLQASPVLPVSPVAVDDIHSTTWPLQPFEVPGCVIDRIRRSLGLAVPDPSPQSTDLENAIETLSGELESATDLAETPEAFDKALSEWEMWSCSLSKLSQSELQKLPALHAEYEGAFSVTQSARERQTQRFKRRPRTLDQLMPAIWGNMYRSMTPERDGIDSSDSNSENEKSLEDDKTDDSSYLEEEFFESSTNSDQTDPDEESGQESCSAEEGSDSNDDRSSRASEATLFEAVATLFDGEDDGSFGHVSEPEQGAAPEADLWPFFSRLPSCTFSSISHPGDDDNDEGSSSVSGDDSTSLSPETAPARGVFFAEDSDARQNRARSLWASDRRQTFRSHFERVAFREESPSVPLSLSARRPPGTPAARTPALELRRSTSRSVSLSRRRRESLATSLDRPRRGARSASMPSRAPGLTQPISQFRPKRRGPSSVRSCHSTHPHTTSTVRPEGTMSTDSLFFGVQPWHPAVSLGLLIRKLGVAGQNAHIRVGGSRVEEGRRLVDLRDGGPLRVYDEQLLDNVLDGFECSSGEEDFDGADIDLDKLVVKCPAGHTMRKVLTVNTQWCCDAFENDNGCLAGKTAFRYRPGFRYQCANCEVDYCTTCHKQMKSCLAQQWQVKLERNNHRFCSGKSNDGRWIFSGHRWWFLTSDEMQSMKLKLAPDETASPPESQWAITSLQAKSIFTGVRRKRRTASVDLGHIPSAIWAEMVEIKAKKHDRFLELLYENLHGRSRMLRSVFVSLQHRWLYLNQWELGLCAQNLVTATVQAHLYESRWAFSPDETLSLLKTIESWIPSRPSLRKIAADLVVNAAALSPEAFDYVKNGFTQYLLRLMCCLLTAQFLEMVASRKKLIQTTAEHLETIADGSTKRNILEHVKRNNRKTALSLMQGPVSASSWTTAETTSPKGLSESKTARSESKGDDDCSSSTSQSGVQSRDDRPGFDPEVWRDTIEPLLDEAEKIESLLETAAFRWATGSIVEVDSSHHRRQAGTLIFENSVSLSPAGVQSYWPGTRVVLRTEVSKIRLFTVMPAEAETRRDWIAEIPVCQGALFVLGSAGDIKTEIMPGETETEAAAKLLPLETVTARCATAAEVLRFHQFDGCYPARGMTFHEFEDCLRFLAACALEPTDAETALRPSNSGDACSSVAFPVFNSYVNTDLETGVCGTPETLPGQRCQPLSVSPALLLWWLEDVFRHPEALVTSALAETALSTLCRHSLLPWLLVSGDVLPVDSWLFALQRLNHSLWQSLLVGERLWSRPASRLWLRLWIVRSAVACLRSASTAVIVREQALLPPPILLGRYFLGLWASLCLLPLAGDATSEQRVRNALGLSAGLLSAVSAGVSLEPQTPWEYPVPHGLKCWTSADKIELLAAFLARTAWAELSNPTPSPQPQSWDREFPVWNEMPTDLPQREASVATFVETLKPLSPEHIGLLPSTDSEEIESTIGDVWYSLLSQKAIEMQFLPKIESHRDAVSGKTSFSITIPPAIVQPRISIVLSLFRNAETSESITDSNASLFTPHLVLGVTPLIDAPLPPSLATVAAELRSRHFYRALETLFHQWQQDTSGARSLCELSVSDAESNPSLGVRYYDIMECPAGLTQPVVSEISDILWLQQRMQLLPQLASCAAFSELSRFACQTEETPISISRALEETPTIDPDVLRVSVSLVDGVVSFQYHVSGFVAHSTAAISRALTGIDGWSTSAFLGHLIRIETDGDVSMRWEAEGGSDVAPLRLGTKCSVCAPVFADKRKLRPELRLLGRQWQHSMKRFVACGGKGLGDVTGPTDVSPAALAWLTASSRLQRYTMEIQDEAQSDVSSAETLPPSALAPFLEGSPLLSFSKTRSASASGEDASSVGDRGSVSLRPDSSSADSFGVSRLSDSGHAMRSRTEEAGSSVTTDSQVGNSRRSSVDSASEIGVDGYLAGRRRRSDWPLDRCQFCHIAQWMRVCVHLFVTLPMSVVPDFVLPLLLEMFRRGFSFQDSCDLLADCVLGVTVGSVQLRQRRAFLQSLHSLESLLPIPFSLASLGFAAVSDQFPRVSGGHFAGALLPSPSQLLNQPTISTRQFFSSCLECWLSGDSFFTGVELAAGHPVLMSLKLLEHLEDRSAHLPPLPRRSTNIPTPRRLWAAVTDADSLALKQQLSGTVCADLIYPAHRRFCLFVNLPAYRHHLALPVSEYLPGLLPNGWHSSLYFEQVLKSWLAQNQTNCHRTPLHQSVGLKALQNAANLPTSAFLKLSFLKRGFPPPGSLIADLPRPSLGTPPIVGNACISIERRLAVVDRDTHPALRDVRQTTLGQLLRGLNDVKIPMLLCGTRRPFSIIMKGERAHDLGGPFFESTSDAVALFHDYYLIPNANAENTVGYNREISILSKSLGAMLDRHALINWNFVGAPFMKDEIDSLVQQATTVLSGKSAEIFTQVDEWLNNVARVIETKTKQEAHFVTHALPLHHLCYSNPTGAQILHGFGSLLGTAATSGCPVNVSLDPHFWRMVVGEELQWQDCISIDLYESIREQQWKRALAAHTVPGSDPQGEDLWQCMCLDFTKESDEGIESCHQPPRIIPMELANCLDGLHNVLHVVDGGETASLPEFSINSSEAEVSKMTPTECRHLLRKFASLNLFTRRSARLRRRLGGLRIMREGFNRVVPCYLARSFTTAREMQLMTCGYSDIDLDLLKKHTLIRSNLNDPTKSGRLINWFWSIVEEMDQEQRRSFVRFISGLSRLPQNWSDPNRTSYGEFEVRIQNVSEFDEDASDIDKRLPTATTCFSVLKLPPYSERRILKARLLTAITVCADIDLDFDEN